MPRRVNLESPISLDLTSTEIQIIQEQLDSHQEGICWCGPDQRTDPVPSTSRLERVDARTAVTRPSLKLDSKSRHADVGELRLHKMP